MILFEPSKIKIKPFDTPPEKIREIIKSLTKEDKEMIQKTYNARNSIINKLFVKLFYPLIEDEIRKNKNEKY